MLSSNLLLSKIQKCAYKNCGTGGTNDLKRRRELGIGLPSMFEVPEDPDLFNKWREITHMPLRPRDTLCELHFHEKDLVNSLEFQMFGEEIILEHELNRYALKPNTLPLSYIRFDSALTSKKNTSSTVRKKHNEIPKDIAHLELHPFQHAVTANIPQIKKILKQETSLSASAEQLEQLIKKEPTETDISKSDLGNNDRNNIVYNIIGMAVVPPTEGNSANEDEEISEPPFKLQRMDTQQSETAVQSSCENITDSEKTSEDPTAEFRKIKEGLINTSYLPEGWCWHSVSNKLQFLYFDSSTHEFKIQLEVRPDFTISAQTARNSVIDFEQKLKSYDQLRTTLKKLEELKMCTGTGFEHNKFATDCRDILRKNVDYAATTKDFRCIPCRQFRKSLKVNAVDENLIKP